MNCPICDSPLQASMVTRGCPSCNTESKDILIEALTQLKSLYLKLDVINAAVLRQQKKLDYYRALDEAQNSAWEARQGHED